MENLEITDREAFGAPVPNGDVKKSWSKPTKVELTEFEKQVIRASETKPVDRVCAAFMINETELNEILSKK